MIKCDYTKSIKLNSPWFEYVRDGIKLYEGRRNFGQSASFMIGDIILVSHYINLIETSFLVQIEHISKYATFEESLNILPLEHVLPGVESIEVGVEIYKKFVSIETQLKDGILMLKLKRVSSL